MAEIEVDINVFPTNVILAFQSALEGAHPAFENQVYARQLRRTDPNSSLGIFPAAWIPDQDSLEMGHEPVGEPTLQRYSVVVQGMNKDSDKDIALARHSTIARLIRQTLYRNLGLRLLLSQLVVTDGPYQERFQKMTIGTQRYLATEESNQFAFLSVLDLTIETETK